HISENKISNIQSPGMTAVKFKEYSLWCVYSNSTAFLIKIKLRHSLGRPSRSDFVQSEFIKEDMDETVFMFALFKCRKFDKRRN
ncbi:hypothetical protein, partial [Agathobacter rectalis]|uniref:hypothetical protein n=1 Tax=Agathobacter rectalis TaxID=39491 RepID=UPI0027D334C8